MNYDITKLTLENPSNENFHLHSHDAYEIYMFLEGDAKYVVEENTYTLEPCDIIVIRRHEMHRVYHNSSARYRRYVLTVESGFFAENGCTEYEKPFTDFPVNAGNKISADIVRSSGLYSAFRRLDKYSDSLTVKDTPIAKALVTEILYLINTISEFSAADMPENQLKAIISHINNHYTENIVLDELERIFFISKYHLCHIFKQATGLTVHGYITDKRLTYAYELYGEGKNLSDAAALAGFSCYSAFYRAYTKKYGMPPKKRGIPK